MLPAAVVTHVLASRAAISYGVAVPVVVGVVVVGVVVALAWSALSIIAI